MKSHSSGHLVGGSAATPRPQERQRGALGSGGRVVLLLLTLLGLFAGGAQPPATAEAAELPGAVVAWGNNRSGQLGLGFGGVQRPAPGTITATTNSGMVAIVGGRNHSVALAADGRILTWGNNASNGELGSGTTADRADPVAVIGGGATAISASYRHTLAVVHGEVFAWGDNSGQQVGPGGTTICNSAFACSRTPVQVPGLANVRGVGTGLYHSLAVRHDGTVWAWGSNSRQQLAVGNVGQTATPLQVRGVQDQGYLEGIVAVAAGEIHSLALAQDGTVYAWGANSHGQLGLGFADTTDYSPRPVPGLGGVVAIASGYRYNLALKQDGTVWAWGFNASGQLGNGTVPSNSCSCDPTPRQVGGLTGSTAIAAGERFALALHADGTVSGWGENGSEQLGGGDAILTTPRAVPGLQNVTAIGGGSSHSLALVPSHALTTEANGPGTVLLDPPGGQYPHGTMVTLTPQPLDGSGALFTGWILDGVAVGHAAQLTLTIDRPHHVVATFAVAPTFCDVSPGDPYHEAVRQLAARGIIRGYSQGSGGTLCFGADDTTQRAQMAALIARPFGWDDETHTNPFTDGGALDSNLWASVGALAHHGVAKGYSAADCAARGVKAPCFGPLEEVTHAQVISFIARGMVAQGYWQAQPDDPALYPNILTSSGHRADIATYVRYAGTLPGTASATAQWGDWSRPAPRSWFAEAEWRALNAHFGQDLLP